MSAHRSFPKPTTRLVERVQQRREALRMWQECVRVVDARDKYLCRCCGRRTRKTLTVCPERAEHHHIVGRNIAPQLGMDPRNVVLVCLEDHGKLHRHEVQIDGGEAVFISAGRQFLNADGVLHFTVT